LVRVKEMPRRWLNGFGRWDFRLNRLLHASANVAAVERAFNTTIATDRTRYANLVEPAVPATLAPLIASIEGLHNTFAIKPLLPNNLRAGPPVPDTDRSGAVATPEFKGPDGLGFSPADFRTYDNESALITSGISGTKAPDCIALAAVSNIRNSSIAGFTTRFRLPRVKLSRVFASGFNPGFTGDAEVEADLDVEHSHATAPTTPSGSISERARTTCSMR
jgi:subtilase family serine protease